MRSFLLINRLLVLTNLLKDLLVRGELTTLFVIGVNHAAVYGHVKDGIMPTYQFGNNAEFVFDVGRQPGGPA